MKKIIGYKDGARDYSIGDVVYLNHRKGKPTCMAIAIKEYNGSWTFKPFRKQAYYLTRDGLIQFGGKPWIFAKQIEVKEEQL